MLRDLRDQAARLLHEGNAEDAEERDRIIEDAILSDEPAMQLVVDVLNLRIALRGLGLAILGAPDNGSTEATSTEGGEG